MLDPSLPCPVCRSDRATAKQTTADHDPGEVHGIRGCITRDTLGRWLLRK